MIQRFNSLIKGPKGQLSDEELTDQMHVSLRPARSVDSSVFAAPQRHQGNTLPGSLVRTRTDESLVRARRRSENVGQTSKASLVIGRVPEERLWKEGYDHDSHLQSPEQYEPREKISGGATEPQRQSNMAIGGEKATRPPFLPVSIQSRQSDLSRVYRTSSDAVAQSRLSEPPKLFKTSSDAVAQSRQSELPARVLRTSSDAVAQIRQSELASRVLRSSGGDAPLVALGRRNSYTAVDIPDAQAGSGVDLETVRKSVLYAGPGRTISSWSTDSAAEHCRICQSRTEEPLIDLGCACRGEMAKSHKSCIEMWFKNKGTNKCEVCQHVASNIPAPATSPAPHFWVWRLGVSSGFGAEQTATLQEGPRGGVGLQSGLIVNRPVLLTIVKKHPLIPVLWVGLLAFMTYLFVDAINTSTIGYAAMPIGFLFAFLFDILISVFLGASALPVNIIIGVLVVLGLGTAVRLVLEFCHERAVQRSIRQMELLTVPEDPAEGYSDQSSARNGPPSPV